MRIGTDPPIPGAEVFIDEVSVGLTGADGSLTVAEVTAGPHTIRAHKDGYVDASAAISVPETTSVTLTLTFITLGTEVRLSSDKTSYAVGAHAYLTQGLYDEADNLISDRTVDYTVTLDGVWYAGWGQYSDDPSRDMILSKEGTYTITGNFVGDDTYKPSSKTITITARKIGTSIGISSDKTSYTAGETAHLTLGLYDEYGSIIDHSRIVDYTVTLNGAWHAGWGQYGDDPTRDIILSKAGTYVITGNFPGDDTYEPSSNAITVTAITRTYTITIHVEGSGPIQGAEVLLDGVSVGLTNSLGMLTIPEVTAGSHTIEARKDGYSPDSATISVPETTAITLALTRLVYTVTVTVTGSQISGASIYLDGSYVGATDATGTLTITEVTAGSHTIEARKSGYESDSATISVPETTSVTLTLTPIAPPTYTVSVHVEGSGPIAGARVYIGGHFVGETDSAGNVTIVGVTAGTHTISAFKYGYEPASATISVPETTSVTLTLTPVAPPPEYSAVTILVREKVPDVPAIEGAKVVLDGMTDYTDAGGYAFFDNVEYGTRYCTVSKYRYKTWSGPLLINAATEMAYIYMERA